MSESLRDQLLKSGLARTLKPEPRPKPPQQQRTSQQPQRTQQPQRNQQPPRNQQPQRAQQQRRERSDIDLAKAYALRDNTERAERERVQREAEARAREKRERKQRLATLLNGAAQNATDAEIPRHFPHANKIRRIYVTQAQLPRLNGGELGIVQLAGRYLLVASDVARQAREIDAEALILLCDPQQQTGEDDVPSDLIW